MSLLSEFPVRQQMNKHDCSVCASWCILTYYGFNFSYRTLYRYIGPPTDPLLGVSGEEIIDLMAKVGISCINEKSSISKLKFYTEDGYPVIASIQHKKESDKSWKQTTFYGHYIIVLKVSDSKVYYMDPNYGKIRSLTIEDFKDRWHDGDENEYYQYPAIVCIF